MLALHTDTSSLQQRICCLTGAAVRLKNFALQLWSKAEAAVMQHENMNRYQQVLTLVIESMGKCCEGQQLWLH